MSPARFVCFRKIGFPKGFNRACLVAQLVKNLPAMQETPVLFLGQEYPLEKGKATHSSTWPIEFHGLYSPWGLKELDIIGPLLLSKG